MSQTGAVTHPRSPWRIIRRSALVALLLVVALFAANVGAHFVVGGHVRLLPDPHLGSPIALSAPSASPARALTAIPRRAG